MSDLPNRDKFEGELTKRLSKLSAAQLAELKTLLGSPPLIANVPREFWDKLEKDAQMALAVVLASTFRASYRNEGWADSVDAQNAALTWSEQRAGFVADLYRHNTVEHVRNVTAKRLAGEIDEPKMWDSIEASFSLSRMEGIGVTEITAGHTAGIEYVNVFSPATLIWHAEKGACEKCKALNETDDVVWRAVCPDGPPTIHPRCRCWLSRRIA